MSKDLITGEIAVAIHLLEPTIIVSTCVVAALYWRAAPRASGYQPRLEAAAAASGYYYGIVLLRCRKLL